MKAEITRDFRGRGDHDGAERYFVAGEVVHGALAEAAVKDGFAVRADVDTDPKAKIRPSTQRKGD